ncbi:MAG TPA: hypothetical protein VK363_13490 [Pyrinomonadaceae bacterium]|nr:hypothetical protein [Pyrinomonadaceae bacterium]
MNCQQFTSLIVEAARGRMMDAAARDGAMRHTEACAACAARLAQEQNLTAAFRVVAHDMKDLCAPADVEAKLLAAFHTSLASSNAVASATTTNDAPVPLGVSVAPPSHASLGTRRVSRAALAIAASLVLAALVALYAQFTRTTPSQQDSAANNQPERGQQSSPQHADTTNVSSPLASSNATSAPLSEGERPQAQRRDVVLRASRQLARRATPKMITSSQVIDGGSAIIEAGEGESARGGAGSSGGATRPNEPESMTDFISLVADQTPAPPLESGQLVRVQVPRAALASLGLPLNAERGNEPVKADVLVGYDGLARAIRFVR